MYELLNEKMVCVLFDVVVPPGWYLVRIDGKRF